MKTDNCIDEGERGQKRRDLTQRSERRGRRERQKILHRENGENRRTQRKRERSLLASLLRMTDASSCYAACRATVPRSLATINTLAHAGYYYGDVVGLFGCAGPLFGGGDQIFGDRLRVQAALAKDFVPQAVDAEFFAVDIFGFG